MMANKPHRWEVWLVDMPFEEGIGSKLRPALVLDPEKNCVLVGKMTTHTPRSQYPYEYQLRDWHGAGLNHPTTLRLSMRARLEPDKFRRKLGVIQPVDFIEIRALLMEIAEKSST